MARLVIYKSPTQGGLSEESSLAWEDLAGQLRSLGHDVGREDRYMEPGRRGVVWGEVVWIYIAMKAADTVTGHAMDAALERIIDTAKAWGRERFGKRRNSARAKPTFISFLDQDGKVIWSWKIDKEGEQEQTLAVDESQGTRRPLDLESPSAADRAMATGVGQKESREPAVWFLLRLTHEDTHLRVDAFVGDEHRGLADITALPTRFVVTPTHGRAVIFRVCEADNELGAEVTAPGWRCDLSPLENSDAFVVLCYEEHRTGLEPP